MALHWTISHPQRLVIALAKGQLAFDELDGYLAALVREEALGYRKIFDVTHAPGSLTPDTISALAQRVRGLGERMVLGPLAIVAASDESYIQARQFAAEAVARRPLTIFREMHAARRWLDGAALPEARDPQPPPFRDDSGSGRE